MVFMGRRGVALSTSDTPWSAWEYLSLRFFNSFLIETLIYKIAQVVMITCIWDPLSQFSQPNRVSHLNYKTLFSQIFKDDAQLSAILDAWERLTYYGQ